MQRSVTSDMISSCENKDDKTLKTSVFIVTVNVVKCDRSSESCSAVRYSVTFYYDLQRSYKF